MYYKFNLENQSESAPTEKQMPGLISIKEGQELLTASTMPDTTVLVGVRHVYVICARLMPSTYTCRMPPARGTSAHWQQLRQKNLLTQ